MAIPRGRTYHTLELDLRSFARALVMREGGAGSIRRFEERFAAHIGRAYCVALPKARTAVSFALAARDLPVDARIVMPPITIKPMMDVVLQRELVPDFVDIELETFGFDPNELESRLTSATRAILVTYLYGMVPDMEPLLALAARHGLFVIEDFSHNLNATYRGRPLGSLGDVGVYSASATKALDTFGGGLVVTDDHALAERLRVMQAALPARSRGRLLSAIGLSALRGLGTREPLFSVATFRLLRWARRERPDLYRSLTGAVERHVAPIEVMPPEWLEAFTGFQADVGSELLGRTVEDDARRLRNVARLRAALAETGLRFPRELEDARCVYWQLIGLSDRAAALQSELAARGVDTATSNLDLLSESPLYPAHAVGTPNARHLKRDGLFIPAHSTLCREEIDRVAGALVEAARAVGLRP